ncbi:TRAF3-interacting 1-like protein [Labeo rohita]|uniref:TRAF3-interacting protein 1 n=2 Tax=Labeonini TaxID=2743697 RepID=A0A498MY77_LABRO|nr:TRAF3-interacting 1-like protein [Labeo rohita]
MNESVAKKTQETLGKVIKKPPLTEKLLSKPPFRYLHDIFSEVIRTTGFMKGLYGEAEMKSDNVKDKDSKIVFLQKAIDVVMLVSGEPLAAKPARIVAGHEPEKTNELLQVIAKCCLNKLSSDEAVKRVLAGDKQDQKGKPSTSRSQDKENREGREHQRDREIKAAEEISKPKPHPEVVNKTHEAEADEAESPSRIPRPSSAKGQRRWPKTGGQDETDSEGEGEAPSAEKAVLIENGDTIDSVPPQTTHRRLPRPSSARPAAPRVKRQESYADVTPAERLGSGKTPATVILDGKKLSEDEDDEDGQFVVEEAAVPPPDIPEIERNSLELQGDDKHGGLVKKILETKKDYESSPSTKSKEQDRSLVSEASRRKERELVAKEIERLRSSIQTVCRSALPLGKIMDYIQEDMDSMQNELQTWRKENKENAQALLQEQRITDSVVEPLKAELTELEQLIKDQQDKICAVKSNILKNEEKIQKMVSSISFSSQTKINEKLIWSCGLLPCTPLRIAAMMGHSECVEYLISQGAAVDLVDVKGQTALYMAVVNGHLDCVKILLKAGADPNGSFHHRSTPLYHAAQVGRADIILELIRFNADVDIDHRLDQRSLFGTRTLTTLAPCPLFISAAYHHLPCFRMLLNTGANPNYNFNGSINREVLLKGRASCMLDAVLKLGCEPAFVSLLLDHGADPYLVPWEELDPDTMVRLKVNTEALRVYQEAKRNPRRLMNLCRIAIRKIMGKKRLSCISSLPLPETVIKFMSHKD